MTSRRTSAGTRLTITPNTSQPFWRRDSRATLAASAASAAERPLTTASTGQPSAFARWALRSKSSAGAAPAKSVPSQTTASQRSASARKASSTRFSSSS